MPHRYVTTPLDHNEPHWTPATTAVLCAGECGEASILHNLLTASLHSSQIFPWSAAALLCTGRALSSTAGSAFTPPALFCSLLWVGGEFTTFHLREPYFTLDM